MNHIDRSQGILASKLSFNRSYQYESLIFNYAKLRSATIYCFKKTVTSIFTIVLKVVPNFTYTDKSKFSIPLREFDQGADMNMHHKAFLKILNKTE